MQFDWDAGNIGHIASHGVLPKEAEQVIANRPFDLKVELRNGEERFTHLGETDGARVLVVVTTERGEKIRVVTAYPADRRMRRLYERLKGASNDDPTQDA